VLAGIDMFMEPDEGRYQDFQTTLMDLVAKKEIPMSRIDDAVRRILRQKFELGPVRAPLHRPPQARSDRLRAAPQGGAQGRRRVAGAAQEQAPHAAAAQAQQALRRRQQRRQHRQPGGWLDDHLAGQLQPPDPRRHDPRRDPLRLARRRDLQQGRVSAGAAQRDGVVVVGETPYAEGFGDVGGPQWGYDPGDNGVPRRRRR
jgi:beta-glucosidase